MPSDGARKRVAVLISGRGSNMQALVRACEQPDYPARIALVLSNKADAAGLAFAEDRGIATAVISHRDFATREAFDAALDARIRAHDIDFICLAGFMRILTPGFIRAWPDRMLNIHPSLLPSFRGLTTHQRALDAGVKIHGCTVHLVRPELDEGPILLQAAVPVMDDDDEESLGARVLAREHAIYPQALSLLVRGLVDVDGLRCRTKSTGGQPVISDPAKK